MTIRKYNDKFFLIYLFIFIFSNLQLRYYAKEIRKNEKPLNISNGNINWKKLIDNKDLKKNKLKWEKYYPGNLFEELENNLIENTYQKELEDSTKQINDNQFLYLGFAVPNADVLNKNDFMIYAEQLFPFYKSDLEEGTANQNYSVFLGYGISENIMMMGFFSHSDDPLYRKINNVEEQPANKWISVGIGTRFNIFR